MANFRSSGNGASVGSRPVSDRPTGGESAGEVQINDTQDLAEACVRGAEDILNGASGRLTVMRARSLAQLANAAARNIAVGVHHGRPREDGVSVCSLRTK